MKKKVLFTTYDLNIGGVESCLVNLVNNFDYSKYDVTILLQNKSGDLLNNVNKEVHVVDYNLSRMKFSLLRKCINMFMIIYTKLKYYRKFDFSISYGTGYKVSSEVALLASKNNAAYMHTNIIKFMENSDQVKGNMSTTEKVDIFLKRCKFRKFKKNIFISAKAMEAYLSLYPEDTNKVVLCHNYIDYDKIIKNSKVKVDDMYDIKGITFINVSRHTEYDKRLSRIINACDKLKKDGYKFKMIMIGDGADHKLYLDMVREKKLEDYVIFYGKRSNPFPYIKNACAFVMSSEFEGFPTTFGEAMTLNVPLITTDVSDAKELIENKYGIVVDNNDDAIYDGMKEFLDNGFKVENKFSPKKYNAESMNKLCQVIEGEL